MRYDCFQPLKRSLCHRHGYFGWILQNLKPVHKKTSLILHNLTGLMIQALMDDLRFRKIFNLGITKDISGKKLSKLEKLQSLVAKCYKIRKI